METEKNKIHYTEIFLNAPFAIVIITQEGIILDANQEFINLFKYSKEELIGKDLDDMIAKGESKKEAQALSKQVLESKIETETIRYDKFNKPINVGILAKSVVDSTGNSVIFVTYKDITDKVEQQKRIRMQQDVIKLINKILRHDLMNYFSVIRSAFRIYRETKEPELLDEAYKKTEMGISLIRSMKSFENFEYNTGSLQIINVKESIENLFSSFDISYSIKGNIFIKGNQAFDRILENLINNAIKHGKATRIDIELVEKTNESLIIIKDNGLGIPDEIKTVIFKEGFSFGKSGNTGMGLFIVKKMMELFNGEVEVKDNSPQGAVFILHFYK